MRHRLRELGIVVGRHDTGPANSITDVEGVRVGHVTLVEDLLGRAVRTGVTAVVPSADPFRDRLAAASFVLNGYGKTIGLVQVEELGAIESPIMLTNTFAVPMVAHGTIQRLLALAPEARSANVVVAECNDGYLNDIRGLHVRPEHAIAAIDAAGRDVAEGSVGAGTGMSCFGYKGGIGTSSRRGGSTLGTLVLANFGQLSDLALTGWLHRGTPPARVEAAEAGSIVVVVATDAPLDARQLGRVARRAALGIARSGGHAAHGSGDIVIAFSTARGRIDDRDLDELFSMTPEAVHEAILNALCVADRMVGTEGRLREAFPYEQLAAIR